VLIDRCPICTGSLEVLIDLPSLPLTGLYTTNPVPTECSYDNELAYCPTCGHGALTTQLDPGIIYNDTYTHRTSKSNYAVRGVGKFLDTLYKYCGYDSYGTVLDIGCSDGYMLSRIPARRLIGIDAAASSIYEGVEVITGSVEEVDISSIHPDVILMRHTIEHLQDPVGVMIKVVEAMTAESLLVIQTPTLDILVDDLRYDHIFHQHLHYFTISSLMTLLDMCGLECIHYAFDRYDWGSIILITKLGHNTINSVPPTIDHILDNYYRFRSATDNVSSIILNSREVVGYGAAQMLPVIGHHISNFDRITTVVDDDPSKGGKYYYNMPVRITNELPDTHTTYLVTGVDSSRGIMRKLIDMEVDRIVNILPVI
jgi:hypothetical protein